MANSKLRYEDLPVALARIVSKNDFLRAVARPEAGTIVVWVLDRKLRRQREVEFDLSQDRFLSNEERMATLPDMSEIYSEDAAWKIRISYRFERDTDVCYEVYSISPVSGSSQPIEAQQIYFGPGRTEVGKIVEQAIKKANFPKLYVRWSKEEKVEYWVSILYRLRRSNAESGMGEDSIFDKKLVSDMRRVDSKIENILYDIIHQLAVLENIDPPSLLDVFQRRTGRKLAPKK